MGDIWTFETETERAVRHVAPGGRVTFAQGPVLGAFEHMALREGIFLYRLESEATHAFLLDAPKDAPPDEMILGCILEGSGEIHAAGNADQVWRQGGQAYAVSLSEREISYRLLAGKPLHLMALRLAPDALDLLARDEDVPDVVIAALSRRGEPISILRPGAPAMLRAARELLQPSYRGAMARLHQEAKASEFLALHLDALRGGPRRSRELSGPDLVRVREAQERLLASLQDPPDVSTLARQVGLTPKKLNAGFRQLFGTTVFDYLLEARLQAARRLLDERPDVPLKQLAWSLGYSQVSNFVSAFRRRYGISPGSYRRGTR